jgi:pSer/pThr/pTyr-binding forkhead associated (FHA) protein
VLALKILTGQQMGKVIQLKDGVSVLGRSPECDIIIANNNVSKKHASLEKKR